MIKFFKERNKKDYSYIFLKNIPHSWIGHIIRDYQFLVNILEGTISGKNAWEDLDCNT
jgi:hypothetical protein